MQVTTSTNEKIPKKRWMRILPLCFLVNFITFANQQIISYTMTSGAGMAKELAISSAILGTISGIYAIGGLFLQFKLSQIANKGKSKVIIAILLACCGFLSIIHGMATSGSELIIIRFLLGFAGGGLSSALSIIITNWFPGKESGNAFSKYFLGNSLCMVVMGPIVGFGLSQYGWRVPYYAMGVLNLIIAVAWFLLIEDRPQDADWLDDTEKEYILNTFKEESINNVSNSSNKNDKISIIKVIFNKNVIALGLITFIFNSGTFGFGIWMPSLVGKLMQAGTQALGWLTVLPNILAMVGLQVWGILAGKSRKHRLLLATPLFSLGALLLLGTLVKGTWSGYVMICIAAFFLQSALILINIAPAKIFSSEMQGVTRGVINTIGALGGFFGPFIVGVVQNATNSSVMSMGALFILLLIGAVISMMLPKSMD